MSSRLSFIYKGLNMKTYKRNLRIIIRYMCNS